MTATLVYPHIVKDQGEPARLAAHPRLRVSQIIAHYLAYGRSPEEICLHLPHLRPGEVYAAMAYYFDHKPEIDSELRSELEQLDRESQSTPPSPIWTKLKGQGLI